MVSGFCEVCYFYNGKTNFRKKIFVRKFVVENTSVVTNRLKIKQFIIVYPNTAARVF